MRYFIRFSYDGSRFYGFQRLNHFPSVQKALEDALCHINGSPVEIKGAGRTDRGVHAKGQCAHFDLIKELPEDGLLQILDKLVGPYIHIRECKKVSDDFHARFSVLQKKYRYRLFMGEYDPCLNDYVNHCSYSIDFSLMEEASKLFLGVYDFQNFVSGERDNYQAIIYQIDFVWDGDFLDIVFVGKSFYRYMVRNIVGALLDVGRGKRNIEEIEEALQNPFYDKRFSTAISNGLYLEDIVYEFDD